MHQAQVGPFEQFADPQAVAEAAAAEILSASQAAVSARGCFRIVLAGGASPLAAYRLLAREALEWNAWEVYFGDERCLPREDPERNSQAASEALLAEVPIRSDRIFPIRAELGAERAAALYAETIAAVRPFDLVLLGMGEDGHTASLFPGHPMPDGALVIPVRGAPKPPPERVTLTPTALADCRRMLVLVTGEGKRAALADWRAGADLPVARVAEAGRARVLIDREAAGA
jgi:6-phosphogluconolactonase